VTMRIALDVLDALDGTLQSPTKVLINTNPRLKPQPLATARRAAATSRRWRRPWRRTVVSRDRLHVPAPTRPMLAQVLAAALVAATVTGLMMSRMSTTTMTTL